MQWEKATDIILYASFLVLAVFAILGLVQWLQRKSISKVDRTLVAFIPPLVIMAVLYFLFDKVIVLNTRPNGSGESSFPSTHTMVVATIFFMAMLAFPKYIKSKPLCVVLDLVMLILLAIICAGRIITELHWPSDVVCGVVFAAILACIYYLIAKPRKEPK